MKSASEREEEPLRMQKRQKANKKREGGVPGSQLEIGLTIEYTDTSVYVASKDGGLLSGFGVRAAAAAIFIQDARPLGHAARIRFEASVGRRAGKERRRV